MPVIDLKTAHLGDEDVRALDAAVDLAEVPERVSVELKDGWTIALIPQADRDWDVEFAGITIPEPQFMRLAATVKALSHLISPSG